MAESYFGSGPGEDPWQRRGENDARIAAATFPVGMITAYYGTTAPPGWLLCDGAAIPGTYAALIALVGANTPNLKGKVIVGVNSAETEFDTLGETGGSKTSTAPHDHNLASHTHNLATHDHNLASHGHGLEAHLHTATHNHNSYIGNTSYTFSTAHSHHDKGGFASEAPFEGNLTPAATIPVNTDSYTGNTGGWTSPGGINGPTVNTSGGAQNVGTAQGPSNNTSGASSAAATSGNLQPYMAISYIIKAG